MKKLRRSSKCLALGLVVAAFGRLTVPAQTVVPTTHVLPSSTADHSKPGFTFNISEVNSSEPNVLAWAEDQLAGLEGANLADPTAVGVAAGPATPANPATAPISFYLTNVINLSKIGGSGKGNFTPDDQMPGLPGTGPGGGSDNAAAEILTYLDLPAGTITMGVNSDDGFRVTIGGAVPQDKFAVNVGQFDGGRGAADTIFQFQVPQAGLYAARLLWENGGGDANVEWFTILDGLNGTNKVLVNDLANGGIPAYAAVTQSHAYVQKVDPAAGASNVNPNEGIHLALVDGSVPVATSSVALTLDGVVLAPVLAKNGNVLSVDYTPPAPWASMSTHTATFVFADGALHVTNTWSWTVQYYISLDASWRVSSVDTNKPGFIWNMFANATSPNNQNSNERAEADLMLQAYDSAGTSLPNNADPTAVGAALAAGTALSTPNGVVRFEIATTINLDIATPNMPGSPSTDGTTDGQAAEVLTYLALPAGVVQMQVDSDDGWRLYAGAQPADAFGRSVVGEHNNGTGPVKFSFMVPQAGTYPFRMIWENGTGGSRLNWYSIDNSGKAILVNDVANGGLHAYRALVAGTTVPPIVTGVSPLPALHQLEVPNTNLVVVLADGTHPVNDASVKLTVDGKSVTPITQRQGNLLTVSDGGAAFPGLQLAGDVHVATLIYSDSTGAYSRTQRWTFNNIESLILPATPLVKENFDSYPEATSSANTVPPGWKAWNFTAVNTPGWDLADKSSDSYKDWIIISTTTATSIEGSSLNNDPNQLVNGQPVTDFASGNVLWATSDGRSGPQVQFCTSAPFDLSSITNPVLIYSSLLRASANANAQADGIEYSIDGGNTWLPGIIYVTIAYNNQGYVKLTSDGSIDVIRTLTAPFDLFGSWVDPVTHQTMGGNFASGLEEPVTQALASYIAPRSQNVATSTKVDGFRLPLASKQRDVRLRFYQLGNCSWWWGVDNLAFYDLKPPYVAPQATPHIDSITVSAGQVTIRWSNGGTLEATPSLTNPVWTSTGNSSGNFTEPVSPGKRFYRARR